MSETCQKRGADSYIKLYKAYLIGDTVYIGYDYHRSFGLSRDKIPIAEIISIAADFIDSG